MSTPSTDTAQDYGDRVQSEPASTEYVAPNSKVPADKPFKPVAASFSSTVALKALMAVSGLLMVGFLVAHMLGNLWVFAGRDEFNTYAHHIRTLGEPMLPHKALLWIMRIGLIAAVLGHIFAAVALWKRNVKAVGGTKRYHSTKGRRGVQRSYASFTMRWGGVIILVFIVYHLLHFTGNQIHPGGASDDPYQRVVNGFEIWWVVLSYTIAMLAVGFHLAHGFFSAVTTLGGNTSEQRRKQLQTGALGLALVLTIGFLVPAWSILFGWVG